MNTFPVAISSSLAQTNIDRRSWRIYVYFMYAYRFSIVIAHVHYAHGMSSSPERESKVEHALPLPQHMQPNEARHLSDTYPENALPWAHPRTCPRAYTIRPRGPHSNCQSAWPPFNPREMAVGAHGTDRAPIGDVRSFAVGGRPLGYVGTVSGVRLRGVCPGQ